MLIRTAMVLYWVGECISLFFFKGSASTIRIVHLIGSSAQTLVLTLLVGIVLAKVVRVGLIHGSF